MNNYLRSALEKSRRPRSKSKWTKCPFKGDRNVIQTSFFSSKAPRGRKVSIAKWPPRYWQGPRAPKLAPSNPKAEDWAAAYRRDLENRFLTESSLRLYLREIERETPDPILCCYEADANECHRRVLAAYIKEKLNWDVPEWRSKGPEQASLL